MNRSIHIFKQKFASQTLSLFAGSFYLVLFLATAPATMAAATIVPAVNNGAYTYSPAVEGLNAASNTHDFSVTAWGICRYIDVGVVPGGQGLLIPFASDLEWRGGVNANGTTIGFIATTSNRPYVTLDFCRPSANFPTVNYAGAGGLSDAGSLVAGQTVVRSVNLPQQRVDAQHDDGTYMASLRDSAAPVDFNMQRTDCLGNITYPDGSVRNPCYTWNWVETITASFRFDNNMTRTQALQELGNPQNGGNGNWLQTLTRTGCKDLTVTSNDGRATVTNSCPPAVKPPVLRNCAAAQHNQRSWSVATTNNVLALHDCAPNTVEGPARQRHWDTEAESLCFDGTDYPTGATRNVNVHITGTCTPIVPPPVPQCAPFSETRNGACPVGQTGTVTEMRQRNVGSVCGVDSSWSVTGNTCVAVPICTEAFETRNGSCPAGSTGTVVERRTTNVGNVCNANSNWAAYSSNCASCTSVSTVTLNCTAAGLGGNGLVSRRTTNNTCDMTTAVTILSNSGCCKQGVPANQTTVVNGFPVPGCGN